MNLVDFFIALLVILAIFRGMEIGIIRQASSLVGLIIGIVGSSYIASLLHANTMFSIIIIGLGVLGAIVCSEFTGVKLKKILHEKKINKLDRFLGAILGSIVGLGFVWFAAGLLPVVPSISLRKEIRDSRIIARLDATLPPTTTLMNWLENSLAQTKIPEIISEFEPKVITKEATLPKLEYFNNIVTSAQNSVVEIEGRSCSGVGVGSGFIVAPNYIVTNAHVVAGMRYPFIQDVNGRHAAQIVAFDPNLDIAVLKTERLQGKSITLSSEIAPIDTQGVVLGYPGGGPFKASPAVIMEHFTALGKDIYNESDQRRDVYALKADVEPGNSGGPLLDSEGKAIGVIFARSTVHDQVGYALSAPAVQQVIYAGQNNANSGSSLRCLP